MKFVKTVVETVKELENKDIEVVRESANHIKAEYKGVRFNAMYNARVKRFTMYVNNNAYKVENGYQMIATIDRMVNSESVIKGA